MIATQRTLQASALLAVALAATPTVRGAEWTRSSGLSINSYYSSNICQIPNDEESKAVGTVTPRIDLRAEGRRAQMNLNAAVEYNTLSESSLECPRDAGGIINPANRETWVPRINFTGEIEALESAIYLEADANATQNPINPFAPGGGDNINATGNTNITYGWGVGGRLDRRHSDQWASLVRYNYNEQYNSSNNVLGDSKEDRVELDVGMVPEASRLSVGMSGQYSEVTVDETVAQPEFTNRLSRLQLRAALQLDSQLQINGFAGNEDNVFLSSSDEIDGEYWDVGIRWAPNMRSSVDLGYGERFFGPTPRAAVEYRHKRQSFRLNYSRDLQLPRDIRAAGNQNPDDPLNSSPGLPGEPLPGASDPTFLGQRPVLNESFTLGYRFTARRTTLSISTRDSQQTRTLDGGEGSFRSVNLSASRTLGPRHTLDSTLSWSQNEGNLGVSSTTTPQQELETWRASLGLQRRLAADTTLVLRYTYTDQDSFGTINNGFQRTFDEHRIELGVQLAFGRR